MFKKFIYLSMMSLIVQRSFADNSPSINLQKVNGHFTNCLNKETDLLIKKLNCDFSKNLNADILSLKQNCNTQMYTYLLDQRTSIENVTIAMEQLGTVDASTLIENKINAAMNSCGVNGSFDIQSDGSTSVQISQ